MEEGLDLAGLKAGQPVQQQVPTQAVVVNVLLKEKMPHYSLSFQEIDFLG